MHLKNCPCIFTSLATARHLLPQKSMFIRWYLQFQDSTSVFFSTELNHKSSSTKQVEGDFFYPLRKWQRRERLGAGKNRRKSEGKKEGEQRRGTSKKYHNYET